MTNEELAEARQKIVPMLLDLRRLVVDISGHRVSLEKAQKTYTLDDVLEIKSWTRLENKLFQMAKLAESADNDQVWPKEGE